MRQKGSKQGSGITTLFAFGFSLMTMSTMGQLGFFEFVSPKPDSEYHNPEARLVLRSSSAINLSDVVEAGHLISITGELSGEHDFDIAQSRDRCTINIVPRHPFELDETVFVSIGSVFIANGEVNDPIEWSFSTRKVAAEPVTIEWGGMELMADERDLPELEFIVPPQDGLFEENIFGFVRSPDESYMWMSDFEGNVIWTQEQPEGATDFKLNRNGLPTFFNALNMFWEMRDAEFQLIRTFSMVDGYEADFHDFQILADGHYFVFAYDDQLVDVSDEFPEYQDPVSIEGFVIQELDYDDNLILQWRSWDYFNISDNEQSPPGIPTSNPFHINSLEIDEEGNMLISCRHTNEITKIDRISGDIIWRLTTNAVGQFDFANDAGFSHQHDCRSLGNNRLLLFDNANESGQVSRAVEYELDTVSWVATKMWEFIHPEQLYASARGGSQRLPNGNTIIMWGDVSADEYGPRTTEVSAEGDLLLDMAFELGYTSYRSPKHDWAFEQNYMGGCGDVLAENFDPLADYWLPEFCAYDLDEDGWTDLDGDCDDTDESINPDAEEIPNDGIDQDCNGVDSIDLDEDGFSVEDGDCNDDDETINPDAEEIPNDGIDQDCDGSDFVDVDGDGFSVEDGDCNDNNEEINPDAEELPYDGIDQDCDGEDLTDVDGDGFSPDDGDCNDNDFDINPDAEEIPNDGIDQDCDGEDLNVGVDEILNDISFYPNPTSGQLYINISIPCEFTLYDTQGRMLKHQLLNGDTIISLRGRAAGVYYATLRLTSGEVTTKQIMLSPAQ